MSRICKLDSSYDLWLSYTWSNNDHGICGHLYEVIEYFMILKDHFKVGILLAEDVDIDLSKYDFSQQEVNEIHQNIIKVNKPSLIQGTNILFVDGGVVNNKDKVLLFDNIMYFACGNKQVKDNEKQNVYILQDDRVYEPVKVNGINYKKKILLHRLKPVTKSENKSLIYATNNCRAIDDFEQYKQYGDLLVVTNKELKPSDGIEFVEPPVKNIFSKFDTYIYTPVPRKWDCSPRFLAECNHYEKNIIFHDIDYWDEDKGLYWRYWDIKNDFESLYLKQNDEIICIIKQVLSS